MPIQISLLDPEGEEGKEITPAVPEEVEKDKKPFYNIFGFYFNFSSDDAETTEEVTEVEAETETADPYQFEYVEFYGVATFDNPTTIVEDEEATDVFE